jgi:hypothetical protein
VHLTGKSDTGDLVSAQPGLDGSKTRRHTSKGQSFPHRYLAGSPPIFGMLLGPADRGRSKRFVIFGGGGEDAAIFIHDYSASSARSDVDSENAHGGWWSVNRV